MIVSKYNMSGAFRTLDGRAESIGQTGFIVRSCPMCHMERRAEDTDIAALDRLRNWAVGHPLICVATGTRNLRLCNVATEGRPQVRSRQDSPTLITEVKRMEPVAPRT
jgi:hypothetical protein